MSDSDHPDAEGTGSDPVQTPAAADPVAELREALEAAEATGRRTGTVTCGRRRNWITSASARHGTSRQLAVPVSRSWARELLAIADSLELGLEAGGTASVESLVAGKEATLRLLRAAFEKFGIEVVDPVGHPFDPQLHEAMSMQPSSTAAPGSVLVVLQKGYRLGDRLLRPARVIVAGEPVALGDTPAAGGPLPREED